MIIKILMGSLLALSAVNAIAANTYIYKDKDGQVLKTNINPSGDYDKFNKTLKELIIKMALFLLAPTLIVPMLHDPCRQIRTHKLGRF